MRAFIFTMDALISLIPITIALGVTASLIFSAVDEHVSYSSEYEQFMDTYDFADFFIKKLFSAGIHTNASFKISWGVGVPPANKNCPAVALNITEFWVPAKLKMIRNMAGDVRTDILDIGAFSKYASDSKVNVFGEDVYFINASKIADETKFKRSFRIAVISYREKVLEEINFTYVVNTSGIWYYYNVWDENNDGYVSDDDDPFMVVAYGETGNVEENVVSLRLPVMFIYDEVLEVAPYKNRNGINNSVDVFQIPFLIDENGYGTNIMIIERPHKLTVGACSGWYAEATKSNEPVRISRVYITRGQCFYYNISNDYDNRCIEDTYNLLNGTIDIYVDNELVYSGVVPRNDTVDITDNFISAIKTPYPVIRLIARNCTPTLSAPLNLVIEAEEPWVVIKIIARPAYFILEVGE